MKRRTKKMLFRVVLIPTGILIVIGLSLFIILLHAFNTERELPLATKHLKDHAVIELCGIEAETLIVKYTIPVQNITNDDIAYRAPFADFLIDGKKWSGEGGIVDELDKATAAVAKANVITKFVCKYYIEGWIKEDPPENIELTDWIYYNP